MRVRQTTMHVTHVNLSKDLRGGERQMLTLINALSNQVDQAVIVRRDSLLHEAMIRYKQIEIVAVPSSPLAAAFQLRNTDVAHIHEARCIRTGAAGALLFNVPYVITRRKPRKPHRHFLTRYCYQRAGKIAAVSRTVHASMHDYDKHLPLQMIYDYLAPMTRTWSR